MDARAIFRDSLLRFTYNHKYIVLIVILKNNIITSFVLYFERRTSILSILRISVSPSIK